MYWKTAIVTKPLPTAIIVVISGINSILILRKKLVGLPGNLACRVRLPGVVRPCPALHLPKLKKLVAILGEKEAALHNITEVFLRFTTRQEFLKRRTHHSNDIAQCSYLTPKHRAQHQTL